MKQMARNLTMEGCGILRDCRYLLQDRDTKYTRSFRAMIASGQIEPLALPARCPNLNAYAERRVRSVKEECLSTVILFLRAAIGIEEVPEAALLPTLRPGKLFDRPVKYRFFLRSNFLAIRGHGRVLLSWSPRDDKLVNQWAATTATRWLQHRLRSLALRCCGLPQLLGLSHRGLHPSMQPLRRVASSHERK
jgi:hypothetical protein